MRAGSIGASIVLIAVGAVMTYAVTAEVEGFDVNTAGVILMVVGSIGLVISLLLILVGADRGGDTHTETRVVDRD
ncbi:MAG: hypothetical protein U5K29_03115 [Acidimicrobiales bacterium]|nr:hypothetical protein [Acidimicrobiales bacterium]